MRVRSRTLTKSVSDTISGSLNSRGRYRHWSESEDLDIDTILSSEVTTPRHRTSDVVVMSEYIEDDIHPEWIRLQRRMRRTLKRRYRKYSDRYFKVGSGLYLGNCFHSQIRSNLSSAVIRLQDKQTQVHTSDEGYIGGGTEGHYDLLTVNSGALIVTPAREIATSTPLAGPWDPLGAKSFNCSGLNAARLSALREILPKLGHGFQLPLFLAEVADVMAAVKLVLGAFRLLGMGAMRLFELAWELFHGRISRKAIHNAYLGTVLGLLPLVGDLVNLFKTIKDFERQYKSLISKSGKQLESHAQEVLHLKSDTVNVQEIGIELDTSVTPVFGIRAWDKPPHSTEVQLLYPAEFCDEVRPETAKYHLTVWYSYVVPTPPGVITKTLAMLDALGVNWSISQLWQAIPFSFVVDWFANVLPLAEQYDVKNIELYISIKASCESVVYKWDAKCIPKESIDCSPLVDNPTRHLSAKLSLPQPVLYTGKAYSRQIILNGLPPAFGGELRLPRGMRWITLGSLIGQHGVG